MNRFNPFSIHPMLFLIIIFCYASLQTIAQEDAYHTWLRNQLETDYSISGGTWVLPDNEVATNAGTFTLNGVTRTLFDVDGQPFSKGVRLKTENRPENFWQYSTNYSTDNDLATGDVVLAVVWVKGVSAERGKGFLNLTYELGEPPYTSMTNLDFSPSDAWRQWFIPFEVTESLDRSWLSIRLGYLVQEVEIGGIAVLNFQDAYPLDELPRSTFNEDYDGREPDASWRSEAQARIEAYRMQDLNIQVTDNAGNPLPGASIKVDMIRHDFGFGTVVAQNNWFDHPQRETYRDKILNLTGDGRSFNVGVLENGMKWPQWENDFFPGPKEETADLVQFLSDQGIRMRGHTLIWPAFRWMPDDIEENQNDPEYVRSRITTHIDDIMSNPVIAENIFEWDVVNEPAHLFDIANIFGGTDIYADIFEQAAENAPNAKLYLNDYDILTRRGFNLRVQEDYLQIISDIESKGSRVDGVGLQGHLRYPLTPPETVYEILDLYSAGGKSISITEYDTKDVDEFMAGEYMRDFLTVVYSHPAVDNFMMWGIWDPIHWLGDSPMFRDDWSLKPSGQAFMDLVFDDWWTEESGTTDTDGQYETRAFLGTHVIEIEYQGAVVRDTVVFNQDVTDFEFNIDLTTSLTELDQNGLFLGQNRPNPANQKTLIPFGLKEGGQTRVSLINSQGMVVRTLVDGWLPAGQHQIDLNMENLPTGMYTYRLEHSNAVAVRHLVVVR